jgi:uncharacterized protein
LFDAGSNGTLPPQATLDRSKPDRVLADGLDADVPFDILEFGSGSPDGTFFDFAPVHLVSTSSLDRVAALSPQHRADEQRYRPNIVIDTAVAGAGSPSPAGFIDHEWVGRRLRIGDELTLQVIASTPRCAIPTLAHGDLPRDTFALRVPAEHNRVAPMPGLSPEPCVGVYAQVLHPGTIRPGDTVRI